MAQAWFDPGAFGAYYGGFVGAGIGLVGATLGVLASWLVPRGRGRTFLMALVVLMTALGVVQLIVGVAALVGGQPYGIWYPLVLCGGISAGVFGFAIPVIRSRYREAEMRRIQAAGLR